ncbi:putative wd40 protein [Aspergillus ambiguus]|uniref:putative wd40 protein n=1 Tax=Aspergillus ambiguus TaxID=176160 RepID=UPI003CCE26CD
MLLLLILLIFALSLVYVQYSGSWALLARLEGNIAGNALPPGEKSSSSVSTVVLQTTENDTTTSSNQGPSSRVDMTDAEDSDHENHEKIPAESITIAIFCALAYEAVAVKYTLDQEYSCRLERVGSEQYVYSFGRIDDHKIVIARPPEMGTVNAAQCAAAVGQQFPNVRLALMVGIGAGLPSSKHDIRLGDLVVSTPKDGFPGVVQYDFVKREREKDVLKGCLNKPPRILISADGSLQEDEIMERHPLRRTLRKITDIPMFKRPVTEDILFDENFHHIKEGSSCSECDASSTKIVVPRPQRPYNSPTVHRGLILSGDGVIKSPEHRKHLQRDFPDALCLEMEAAGIMDELPCLVVRGICDYADTHKNDDWHYYAAAVAAAYCKCLLRKVDAQEVQEVTTMKDLMDGMKGLAEGISTIQGAQRMLSRIDRKMLKESLHAVEEASFDSYRAEDERECLQGTRTEMLAEIARWGNSPSSPCIFCLEGMAGTGKSTISRTVAAEFCRQGILAASFFFKRGAGDQGKARRLFPTIAWQLASTIPSLATRIQQTVEKEPDIATRMIDKQFEQLLLRPLHLLRQSEHEKPFSVIVIDALDECEGEGDVETILRLLPRVMEVQTINIRFLLTSRPEHAALLGFKRLQNEEHQYLILHTIPEPIITRDILLFLEHRFAEIREKRSLPEGWPGKDKLQALATIAVPLFIFAATVCRFLEDKYWSPEERLVEFLADPASRSASEMKRTYLPILNQLLKGRDEADSNKLKREFLEILGVIVLLARPLSVNSLTTLLDKSKSTIKARIESFRSVLSVPEDDDIPVETLHLSFRDFLVDPGCDFRIDETRMHGNIASRCIRIMDNLRHNVCGLPSYGTQRAEVPDSVIKQHLPEDLRYACRYWAHHLRQSKEDTLRTEALSFLKRHFLHWLEAMSLMGVLSETLEMMVTLQESIQDNANPGFSIFLSGAIQFIHRHAQMASATPLQLYASALIFTPASSIVRENFEPDRSPWINALPQTLEGHLDCVNAVAFSPDGQTVVSGSVDETINLWNAATGEQLQTLEGHSGSTIISGSSDKTIKLWNAATGEQLQTLEGHLGSINAVAFSPNGQTVISGSLDKTIKLWNATTSEQLQTLEGHLGYVRAVAFSPNGQTIASGSDDKTIKLWNTATDWVRAVAFSPDGQAILWNTATDWVNAVAFSPDGQTVVSGSVDETIKLWNAATGEQLRILKGYSGCVNAVAFSSDGQTIVSGSVDNEQLQTLKGHSGFVNAIAFSPDGQTVLWNTATGKQLQTLEGHSGSIIISGSDDKTIKLWNAATGEQLQTLEGHSGSVNAMAFSPDSQIILWNTATGEQLQTLEGHSGLAASQISLADQWVYMKGEKVLWLPSEYCGFSCFSAKEGALALGYPNGRVFVIRLLAPT